MGKLNFHIALVLLLLTAAGLWLGTQRHQQAAPSLIRLHVIAHSNSFYDQQLKNQVKDCIIRATADDFGQARNMAQAKDMADALTDKIRQAAQDEIARQGYRYPVEVVRGNFHFPVKTYTMPQGTATNHSITLPAGSYQALRVVIGDGQGSNWWCVLYPPLCFVSPGQAAPPWTDPKAAAVQRQTGAVISTPPVASNGQQKDAPAIEYRWRLLDAIKAIKSKTTNKTTTS